MGLPLRSAPALLFMSLSACRAPPKAEKLAPSAFASASAAVPAALASAPLSAAPPAPFEARALALGWTGFATLPLDASQFERDHTCFVRFLPAYEGGYRGVVLADQSGRYRIGMAPYASLNQPAVEVVVGGTTFTAPLPAPRLSGLGGGRGAEPPLRPRWLSLTVSVRGRDAQVFLDGKWLGTLPIDARGFTAPWQLGRLARREGAQDQFYGLIDDVALFERALGAAEVLALHRTARLDARLDALSAFVDFDRKRPSSRALDVTLHGAAEFVPVSGARDAAVDAARLPPPAAPARLLLPFGFGQVWMVIQAGNSAGSHHDTAAFAVDFQRVDPRRVEHNPRGEHGASAELSMNQPLFAAAAGRVVALVDCFRDGHRGCPLPTPAAPEGEIANRNLVCLEHAERFVSCYLHLKTVRTVLGAMLREGDVLGTVGKSGARFAHLHFALSDMAEPSVPGTFSDLVTIPFGFSDYDASDDWGQSFQHIDWGIPRAGQWVRRHRD